MRNDISKIALLLGCGLVIGWALAGLFRRSCRGLESGWRSSGYCWSVDDSPASPERKRRCWWHHWQLA